MICITRLREGLECLSDDKEVVVITALMPDRIEYEVVSDKIKGVAKCDWVTSQWYEIKSEKNQKLFKY